MDIQEIKLPIKKCLAQTKSFIGAIWNRFQNIEYTRQEWLLVFGLALVVGIGCKAIAINTVTIGYEDYKLKGNISVNTPPLTHDDITRGPICEE